MKLNDNHSTVVNPDALVWIQKSSWEKLAINVRINFEGGSEIKTLYYEDKSVFDKEFDLFQ